MYVLASRLMPWSPALVLPHPATWHQRLTVTCCALLAQGTHEWQDGVLARIMRTCCKDEALDQKWILFDGPVDTLWIESMNTTLDDNKLLTLLSGGGNCLQACSLPQLSTPNSACMVLN